MVDKEEKNISEVLGMSVEEILNIKKWKEENLAHDKIVSDLLEENVELKKELDMAIKALEKIKRINTKPDFFPGKKCMARVGHFLVYWR